MEFLEAVVFISSDLQEKLRNVICPRKEI